VENLGKKILVVDDDVSTLRLVRETLTALLHCEVDTTPSPEYAFELVLKKKYDLLLFDFAMPTMDGAVLYTLLSVVFDTVMPKERKLPPLILMSGYGANKRAQDLLRQPGVRGLLAKPFTIERLVDKVSELGRA
jgi:CheY-like chemotaxis protein